MATVEFDMGELKTFFQRMQSAARGDFRKDLELFLEGVAADFLRIVQDEIVRRNVMDSRLLLASFEKGADGNVWELTDGGLTLEVGTNVEYAVWVEKGHTQQPGRYIPGYWETKNGKEVFTYDPASEQGLVLKEKWVKGKHYFESALRILDKLYPKLLEAKLQEWLDNYFAGF